MEDGKDLYGVLVRAVSDTFADHAKYIEEESGADSEKEWVRWFYNSESLYLAFYRDNTIYAESKNPDASVHVKTEEDEDELFDLCMQAVYALYPVLNIFPERLKTELEAQYRVTRDALRS